MGSPLAPFREALVSAAVAALGLPDDARPTLAGQLRIPEAGRGDIALPCFDLARRLGEKPPEVAKKLAAALAKDDRWLQVDAVGPYVNVRIAAGLLAKAVVAQARQESFVRSDSGAGKTVVIDFSSPNIAKPLAFHHIRSTVIGAAVGRLHAALGWRVIGINYLGDWGKQFGLLATGFQRLGDPAKRADAKHLIEVYVKANREADVGARKAAIAAPAEARTQVNEFFAAKNQLKNAGDTLLPADKKKLEGRVRSLEKRMPVDIKAWYAELDSAAARAAEELPEVEGRDQEARLFFKRLEDGEATALAEWKEFRETSIAEFERVYARMQISFFAFEGESRYTSKLDAAIAKVAEKPGTRESEGALVVDMPYEKGEPPVLLKTRDGTTLYMTRDIAAALDRQERFDFERSLYVIAQDQALHVGQLKRVIGAMGLPWSEKMTHVAFGRVHGMSTRRGNVIFLDEVLDEAVAKAREICERSEVIDREHLDETVEAIGVGAIVFGDLKNLRLSDYTFKLEDILNFDGLTGPYVQYTHARSASILRKGGGVPESADITKLTLDEERAVMIALARVPEAIAEACDAFEPSILTRSLLELSQATAHWFTSGNQDRSKRILVEEADMRAARLQLVDGVRNVLSAGLAILGVRAPESM